MDLSELRELIRIFERAAVTELEYETEGCKVRLRKELSSAAAPGSVVVERGPGAPSGEAGASDEELFSPDQPIIPAPMVGVFYQSPAPDARPFVQPGDFIEEGQTVCIIEAMKLMNEVRSPLSGTLVSVLVENGEPVEFGQPLFVLESA
jgi:acetyl-CoA carboxylase biotin carboxyl carrier protein